MVINIHKQGGKEEPLTAYQLFYLILHRFYVNARAALYTLLRSTGEVGGTYAHPQMLLRLNGDGA